MEEGYWEIRENNQTNGHLTAASSLPLPNTVHAPCLAATPPHSPADALLLNIRHRHGFFVVVWL